MNYNIKFSKKALKDFELVKTSKLAQKAKSILEMLEENPYSPPLEKLTGDLDGAYSKRLNIQHRVIYEIREEEKLVVILRMWTHYEK